MANRIGGSFAPPLTDKLLKQYEGEISKMSPSPERDVLQSMLNACDEWYQLPESAGTASRPHGSGVGIITDLQPEHAKKLDPHLPWDHELEAMQKICDALPTGLSQTETTDKEITYIENGETKKGRVQVQIVIDPQQKLIRDMAFHLLWHTKELCANREPFTKDKLGV